MYMNGIVFQDPVPKAKKRLYRERPAPRTVIVLKKDVMDFLLTEERKTIMAESWEAQVVSDDLPPEQIPTVFWGIATRTQDFVATIYPHHLRLLTPAELELERQGKKKSDETLLREQLREKLTKEGLSPALIAERVNDIRHWGLEVPSEIVNHYNLRDAYEVEMKVIRDPKNPNQKLLVFHRVNGLDDPEEIRNLPLPIGIREKGKRSLRKSYPRKYLELDRFGSLAWRMFGLLGAGLGCGTVAYLRGEGGLGKTEISVEGFSAALQLTLVEPKDGEKPYYVVLDFIGERDEDLDDLYRGIMDKTPHNPDRVEIIYATKSDQPVYQWQVFKYAIARIRVLGLFYNVIAFHDSGPRAVEAYSDQAGGDEPLVSGGVAKKGIGNVARDVGTGFAFPETGTSVTQLILTLDGDPKDPATMLDRLTSDHNTTAKLSLSPDAEDYPKINVLPRKTSARRIKLYYPKALLDESAYVLSISNPGSNGRATQSVAPQQTYEGIKSYAMQHPTPAYITGEEFKTGAQELQWEKALVVSRKLGLTMSEFLVMAQEFTLTATVRQNVQSRRLAVLSDKGDVLEYVHLPERPGDELTFIGRNDPRYAEIAGGGDGRV